MYSTTALDLHFLIKELQDIISAKIDKIYQPKKEEFLFRLHIPNTGKKILRIHLPNYMYLTDFKGDVPEAPSQFCLFLRRALNNARIRAITQLDFERIAKFVFETKEGKFHLYLELFSQGNLILTTEDDNIKSALITKKWKDRTIRGNIKYEYPKRPNNFLEVKEADFIKIIAGSDKESIVKALANDLGLGGVYAEELCTRAGADKDAKPDKTLAKKLFQEADRLRNSKIQANAGTAGIFPVKMQAQQKEYPSFSAALEEVLATQEMQAQDDRRLEGYRKEKARIEKVIAQQEAKLSTLEESIRENQRKGELLYEHYQEINDILEQLRIARKKYPIKELREKLKDHKIIKEVSRTDVVVELM